MKRSLLMIVACICLAAAGGYGQTSYLSVTTSETNRDAVARYKKGADQHASGQLTASEETLRRLYVDVCAMDPGAMLAGAAANELGLVYQDLGQAENAEFYYLKSIHIIQPAAPASAYTTMNNLAVLYLETRQLGKLERLDLAQIVSKTNAGLERTRANASLGSLALARGNYQEADDLFRQAFAEYEAAGDPIAAMTMLGNLGSSALLSNDPPRALERLEKAIAYGAEHGLASDRSSIKPLIGLGVAEARTGHREQSVRHINEAIDMVERLLGAASADKALSLELCSLGLREAGKKSQAKRIRKEVDAVHRELGWVRPEAADVADMLLGSAVRPK